LLAAQESQAVESDESAESPTGVADELVVGRDNLNGVLADVAKDGGVEFGFVAEVVIDAGEAGAGAVGDVLDGGSMETALGEDFSGGAQKAAARFLARRVVFYVGHDLNFRRCSQYSIRRAKAKPILELTFFI
jgi:hypothetical protein